MTVYKFIPSEMTISTSSGWPLQPKSLRNHFLLISQILYHVVRSQQAPSLCACLQGQYVTPRVINLVLQYLTTAVNLSATWKQMKAHIGSLLGSVVFPLCCFNDEDEELWHDDPQEYIRKVGA